MLRRVALAIVCFASLWAAADHLTAVAPTHANGTIANAVAAACGSPESEGRWDAPAPAAASLTESCWKLPDSYADVSAARPSRIVITVRAARPPTRSTPHAPSHLNRIPLLI